MNMMTMRAVSDGRGGVRHVPTPFAPAPGKGKAKAKPKPDPIKASAETSAQQLAQLLERIERLEEERQGIGEDIKDVYAEAKSTGFDIKTMRTIIKLRRMEKHHRDEADILLETYKSAIGL
jgi:uncharacterized protein (UPF0335 family)